MSSRAQARDLLLAQRTSAEQVPRRPPRDDRIGEWNHLDTLKARIAAALRGLVVMAVACSATLAAAAIAPETIRDLAFGESDARGKAIAAIVASGDASALPLLQAVLDGDVKTAGEDR